MKPPRRIFRATLHARTGWVGRTLALWTAGAVGTAALLMVGQSSDLFGRAQPGPDQIRSKPGQVAVIDGETLRMDGLVVRLAGVHAPARGERCGAVDCGGAATATLAGLVGDHGVGCRLQGYDPLGRPFGVCEAGGADLSQAIVASGWARAVSPGLIQAEATAQRQRAGQWAAAAH